MVFKNLNFWQVFGYFVMFFLFVSILYSILSFFDKLPNGWDYFSVVVLVALVVYVGRGIKYWTSR